MTLAQVIPVPPISLIWAVFQTLGVIVAAFVVMVLVVSHLRYQTEVKRVEAGRPEGMEADDLRLWLLERIRKGPQSLVLFRCGEADRPVTRQVLSANIRRTDQWIDWPGMGVMMVFGGDDEFNAVRAGRRLGGLMKGGAGRVSAAVSPSPAPLKGLLVVVDGLLEALGKGEIPASGWVLPEEPKRMEDGIPEHEKPLLDEVTGVLRHERVPTAVQKILAAHRRQDLPVCLMLCELDDMDTYAEAGDASVDRALLKAAADCLMRNCRETDLVGRVAEGFVVVLSGTLAEIGPVASRMMEAVRQQEVGAVGEACRFTMTAGLAGYPDHGVGPGELFAAAEHALALAGARGRGMVSVYDPSTRIPLKRAAVPAETPDTF